MIEPYYFRRVIEKKKQIKNYENDIKSTKELQRKEYEHLNFFDYNIVKSIEIKIDKWNYYVIADGVKYDRVKKIAIEEGVVDSTLCDLLSVYIEYSDENFKDRQLFFAADPEAVGTFKEYSIKIKSDKGEDLIEEETVDELKG